MSAADDPAAPNPPAGELVYLGLGANLGDRERSLREALRHIAALPDTELLRCSPLYETAPWGFLDQPAFLNLAAELRCAAPPAALHERLQGIEAALGRAPAPGRAPALRNRPRVIDIDILLFGGRRVALPGLDIPHPRLALRRFVLRPLSDLCPAAVPPGMTRSVAELLAACADTGAVAVWDGGTRPVSVA